MYKDPTSRLLLIRRRRCKDANDKQKNNNGTVIMGKHSTKRRRAQTCVEYSTELNRRVTHHDRTDTCFEKSSLPRFHAVGLLDTSELRNRSPTCTCARARDAQQIKIPAADARAC